MPIGIESPSEQALPKMAAHVDIVLDDDRAYRVLIGSGAISEKASWIDALGSKVAVITNATVGDLYLDTMASAVDRDLDVIEIGDGEEFKNLRIL